MKDSTCPIPAVLVVDDDKDILDMLKFSLSANGFSVQVSQNGVQLWDIITLKRPDIILLDIHMNGVDGGMICKRLKENKNTAGIPVLMLSANDNIETISRACGADGFIPKPFNLEKIKSKITGVLETH